MKVIGKTEVLFLNETTCPKCDINIQPYLSNPVNISNVLQYIDSKHIFPIYQQFEKLDDPHDIFDFSYGTHHLIGYKEKSEYGTSITLYYNSGKEYIKCFLRNDINQSYSSKGYYLSSFDYDGKGLMEKIYSNRTEYYKMEDIIINFQINSMIL